MKDCKSVGLSFIFIQLIIAEVGGGCEHPKPIQTREGNGLQIMPLALLPGPPDFKETIYTSVILEVGFLTGHGTDFLYGC